LPADFESRAFGFSYFRATHFDERRLGEALAAKADIRPMAADCRVPAGDVASSHGLMRLGFRKVCMQVTLCHNLNEVAEVGNSGAVIADRLNLDAETVWEHARNFTRDRFSLDPLLPAAGRHRLYYQWFRNSLGGGKKVAHVGPDVCTFSQNGGDVIIDLVSILEKGRGTASRLLADVLEYARQSGASTVHVKTECENTGAWSLYQRLGFVPVTYTSAFHLVMMS